MSKAQHGNREAKKPKKPAPIQAPVAAAASPTTLAAPIARPKKR